ncbi:MAG: glycosyltransferase [Candidatus Pacebacteria bacterium]|nr:glycosyltransferase [Candidatus Paceibacterota bacterium]
MPKPIVSINLVVLNGGKYINHCLDSVARQTYDKDSFEINILDNGSSDQTIKIAEEWKLKNNNLKISITKSSHNHGMWGGQEELLKQSTGRYILFLSVDVILDKNFVHNSVEIMEKDDKSGALQAKVLQFYLNSGLPELGTKIDTCGFKIFRSRKVVNIGHGQEDLGQFDIPQEIFGTEGAAPFFRIEALHSIKILGEIADHDLFWYAEDLDVAWRLRMAGWKHLYNPASIAWHDRQTTKRTRSGIFDFIRIRRTIPLNKRRLEWRNIRCTIIKNDYTINILKDCLYIVPREMMMFLYLLVFETTVLTEVATILRMLPRMLRKREAIMGGCKTTPQQIHSYFS